jgi:hypothetical protein
MSTITASALSGRKTPAPGNNLAVANLKGKDAKRLAEKTIELTTCAQFGYLLRKRMVWFGLTQKQEREHAYDAATNLGGKAFILQFKASSKVLKTGGYAGQRLFQCQQGQMVELVKTFGGLRNSCFYFFPNVGTFEELQAISGNLIDNSFLVDVADIPNPVPPTNRKSGYHYVYLDTKKPSVTITSEPREVKRVTRVSDLLQIVNNEDGTGLPKSEHLLRIVHSMLGERPSQLADMFFKNAALAVLLS